MKEKALLDGEFWGTTWDTIKSGIGIIIASVVILGAAGLVVGGVGVAVESLNPDSGN